MGKKENKSGGGGGSKDAGKGGKGGKGKGGGGDDSGGKQQKGAQSINVRHILVSFIFFLFRSLLVVVLSTNTPTYQTLLPVGPPETRHVITQKADRIISATKWARQKKPSSGSRTVRASTLSRWRCRRIRPGPVCSHF